MRSTILSSTAIAAILSFTNVAQAVTGKLGDAPVVSGNPSGVKYVADFTNSSITGTVSFQAARNGKGVVVTVDLANLPSEGGPFLYHVHEHRVVDGNCNSTLGHLDPYIRGEHPSCNSTAPQTCQVGDLSGKFGKIPVGVSSYSTSYTDYYIDIIPDTNAFVGNRSITIHQNSTTRIACTDINLATSTSNTTYGGNTSTTAPPVPVETNAAMSGKTVGGLLMAVSAALVGVFVL